MLGAPLWGGVAVAALTGAVFGLLHAFLTVGLALSQHVSGLGITLLATALSYYGYRVSFPKVNTPPTITPFAHGVAGHSCPVGTQTPLTLLALLLVPLIGWVLYRTPAGLACAWWARTRRPPKARACRSRPRARRHRGGLGADGRGRQLSDAVGLQRVLLQHGQRPRLDLRGAGGVCQLAAGQGAAGRAAVRILLTRCSCGCNSQGDAVLPYQLYLMLPYALSILALVLVARKAAYPQALMKPYRKGER
jgi:ABC-type uncharacterized transport system permease subunit